MDRRWMYTENRASAEYINGVSTFRRAAEEDMLKKGVEFMPCPCIDCENLRTFRNPAQIEAHLILRGFKRRYTCWTSHGEERIMQEASSTTTVDEVNNTPDDIDGAFDNDMIHDDNLDQMLRDAERNHNEREYVKFRGLMDDSEKPLFPGCKSKYTRLSSVLELLKLKASNGWSDKSFTALLCLLADLLPEGNELPTTTYKAKKVLCPLGMEVQRIHACPNDCILYRKEYANLHVCPVCNASRYKRKDRSDDDDEGIEVKKGPPAKVAWYLPVIPRLKRLFANPKEAKLLRWHSDKRKNDGMLRHPADSTQWRNIDRRFEEFAADPRNIRFGLSTDGMNPFGNMSSRHSTWPVNLCIYNLPPWLSMKRKYIFMSILIQGPKQPGNDIDVYLAPLVEDLNTLWAPGVQVWDAHKREYFTLHCLLFCTINDYPALANLSGQSTKGTNACTHCLHDTESVWLNHSRKTVYMRHRRFLRRNHPYRKMKKQFDGTTEDGLAPKPLSGTDIHDMVKNLDVAFGKGRKSRTRGKSMWKKRSIFWDLPYWEHLQVRHCIDVMHVEKNVCDSLIGLLLNIKGKTKDGINARLDLVDMGIRPELAPKETDKGRTICEPACYTLSKAERTALCQCLHGVKVPSGYSSNMKRLVSMQDLSLIGMKSHDCHVLMTQMLPVAIRGILPIKVRETISRLCNFFNTIAQKVINPEGLDDLQAEVVTTLCNLEMYFPPSFFDIMVHLIVHLVREIKMCGPVFLRSMYPFERYMGILKSYVRNRSRPEGSIVEGYATEEVVEFCVDYMAQVEPIGVPRSRHEGRLQGIGTIGRKAVTPNPTECAKAHFTVLQHMAVVAPYIDNHMNWLRQENPSRLESWIIRQHNLQFNIWLKEQQHITRSSSADTLTWLAKGPVFTVITWKGYDLNGYTFYTRDQDMKSTNQNSGVCIDALNTAGSTRSSYYGFIEEIWELDYIQFKIPLFRCRWVHLQHVKVDKYGVTTVDLERVGYQDEPFVLATQVVQVFYVTDPSNKKRHVVLQGKRRIVGVENVVDEEEYNQFDELPPIGTAIIVQEDQLEEASYTRVDHHEGLIFAQKN